MSVSFPLISKFVVGVASIATPVTLSVVYKDNISELLKTKEKDKTIETSVDIKDEEINGTWNVAENSENNKSIKITYPNSGICSITFNKGDSYLKKVVDKLKEKLIKDSITETEKKYRRALLKKCKISTNNTFSINVDSEENIDLPNIFEKLNEETLNSTESKLTEGTITVGDPSIDSNTKTITMNVTSGSSSNESSVTACTVIGSGNDVDESHLTNSKEDIKTSVQNAINGNKSGFLTKCKRSIDEKIYLTLNKDETNNKYSLNGLVEGFKTT